MTAIDWLIVLLLNGGVIAFGFWIARGTKTSADWFLGKRSLAWWAVGMSMFATNVDNADLVSLAGMTYREGMHIIMVHTLGSLIGASFAAFWLVPIMARAGQYTNAEYLEARFGPALRVLSALIQIQYRTSMLGLMMWSIYLLLTTFLGLDSVVAWSLIVVVVAVAGIYTSWGGLRAVVFTDAMQGVIMFVGVSVIFIAVWNAVGGWSGAVSRLESLSPPATDLTRMGRYYGDDGLTSPWVVMFGWIVVAVGYWSVNHTQTMRLAGARSIWDMKMAALFGTVISMPVMVACAALGVLGRAQFPDLAAQGLSKPDELYPYMADLYLGAGMKGLVVAGILAAAISTFDSMGSSLSALFTRDIYARFIAKKRDDAHYVTVTRWATLGVLAFGFAYIPFIRSKPTMLQAFLTLIPVFVTPLFTIYLIGVFTRAPSRAGVAGILLGSLYGVIALVDREFIDMGWLPSWFTSRWAALSWATGFTALGATLASLGGRRESVRGQPRVASEDAGWLQTSSAALAETVEYPFEGDPPWWARPGVLAVILIAVTAYILFTYFW